MRRCNIPMLASFLLQSAADRLMLASGPASVLHTCLFRTLQVKLAVAFQDIELLPTRAIGAVPAGDNPALLRCAAGAAPGAGLCGAGKRCAELGCTLSSASGCAGLAPEEVEHPCPSKLTLCCFLCDVSGLQAAHRVPPQARLVFSHFSWPTATRSSQQAIIQSVVPSPAGRPRRSPASATFRRRSRGTWCCWNIWSSRWAGYVIVILNN